MDNSTSIYAISMACDRVFVGILGNSEAASALVAEVLHRRFKQWTAYLGVFAPENISLDTRLKYSESISQLVLQFLQIASRNLERINKLEEVLKINNSTGESLQRSVADEVDQVPESGASSPLVESLRALKTAIDGLYRLGIAIRQSSSSTLNQRIRNFLEENGEVAIENLVFFRLRHKFFDKSPKENASCSKSPLSLYRQLAMSISFRYFGLLYQRTRQEKIERDREATPLSDQKAKERMSTGNPVQPRKDDGQNELKKLAGIKQHPQISESIPTTVDTKKVLQKYVTTENAFTAPRSVLSAHLEDAEYPEPPKVDPRTQEAKCPFCGRPILEKDLKKKNWWHHHLDQDLKLYTCLSETCAEPPQLFSRFHEWSQHMDEHHSKNWIEEIHKPLGWFCDVEHAKLYFDAEDEYDRHVRESHPDYEAEKAELKEWGELQRKRPSYTCPICNCVPEELAVIFPWLRKQNIANPIAIGTEPTGRSEAEMEEAGRDKLLHHIGTHLKQLGLISVEYFGDDAEDNSIGSNRGSIPIDEDGEVLLLENPPGYLDPQFEGYVVQTKQELLREDINWSDIKNFDAEKEFMKDDQDPILQHFMKHQSNRAVPFTSKFPVRSGDKIQQILQDANASQCSIYVSQLGKTEQYRTYYNTGESERHRDLEDDDSTIYAIASLTKLLISLLVMIMIDKLSISEKVEHERYRILRREFPDPWNAKFTTLFNRFSYTKIDDIPGNPRLWDILIHFNSLPPMTHVLLGPDGTSFMSKESFLKVAPLLAKLAYANTEENRSIYSNGNFILIGLWIEAIANQPLESVIKEHLFEPLGMMRTYLGYPGPSVTGIALPYTISVSGRRVPAETKPFPVKDIMNAATGAWSCCGDLAIVFRALLNCIQGGPSIFEKETVRHYLLTQSTLDNKMEDGLTLFGIRTTLDSSTVGSLSFNRYVSRDDICSTYRLGRRPDGRQVRAYYLAGHIEGYSSCYYFMPQYSTFVITLTNTTGVYDASDHISRFLLQEIFDLERYQTGPKRTFTASLVPKKVDVLNMSSRAAGRGRKLLEMFAAEYSEKNIDGTDSIQLAGTYVNEDTELSIVIESDSLLVYIVGTAQTTNTEFVRTRDMGLIRTGHDTIRLRPLSDAGFAINQYDSHNWKELTFHLLRDNATKKVTGLERRVTHLTDRFIRRES